MEWTPNKDATEWEVKLRPGVTFHNGKPLTAQDVIYSIRLMSKPTSAALPFVSGINLNELKAVNSTTLRIPLKFPDGSLQSNFVYYNTWIVQDGEKDFSHPVGTGPFKFESFTPGQQSVFGKNADYWMTGKPYVDTIKIVSISDDTARLNALLSGQIDAMAQLPYAQAKAHQATGDIVVLAAKAPQALVFYFDVTKPPFNDNRVRTAMKLIANRPQLVSDAISGFGEVGNDIIGKGLPLYNTSLPQRVQDIEQAKSMLKAAGHSNLQVTLKTSQIIPGFVESATLYAQQAAAAGVKVALQQIPPDSYFNPSLQYLKLAFGQSQWPVFSLKFFYLQALASNAPYNETHWHDPAWNSLLFKAIGETRPVQGPGGLESGPGDPVPAGRLHVLDQRRLRRWRLQEGRRGSSRTRAAFSVTTTSEPCGCRRDGTGRHALLTHVAAGMTAVAVPRVSRRRRASPVASFLVRRGLGAVVSLIAASILIFVAVQVLPGNAASAVLGRNATPQAIRDPRAPDASRPAAAHPLCPLAGRVRTREPG